MLSIYEENEPIENVKKFVNGKMIGEVLVDKETFDEEVHGSTIMGAFMKAIGYVEK
jgi:hypothetical protein